MRWNLIIAAVAGAFCLVPPLVTAEPLTLDDALARAAVRPSLRGAALGVDAARARAAGARRAAYNPELSASAGPQFGAGGLSPRIELGLAQTLERGGKRRARIGEADVLAGGAEVERIGEALRARVETWRTFEHALVARERVHTRREIEDLATALAIAMQATARAGGTTTLRANVLVADAGRVRQERFAAEGELVTALAELARAIGAPPGEVLDPVGALAMLREPPEHGDDAIRHLVSGHPELARADAAVAAASARRAVASSRAVGDITLGVGYAYDPDPDGSHAVVGTVSIPLGVRNRNQGERAATRIEVAHAQLDRDQTRAEIERGARLAYDRYALARGAVSGFDATIIDHLHANLSAAQEAFTRGGLDFAELATTQRELVAARIAYLDAYAAALDDWADLALAAATEVAP